MRDATDIDRVAKDLVDLSPTEQGSAKGTIAFERGARGRANIFPLQFLRDQPDVAEMEIAAEDMADEICMFVAELATDILVAASSAGRPLDPSWNP